MDVGAVLGKEVGKVRAKHAQACAPLEKAESYLGEIDAAIARISSAEDGDTDAIMESLTSVVTRGMGLSLDTVSTTGRDLHQGISKLSKTVDKVLETHLETSHAPKKGVDSEHLDALVREYLAWTGRSKVLESLNCDADPAMAATAHRFEELNTILRHLGEHDATSALEWRTRALLPEPSGTEPSVGSAVPGAARASVLSLGPLLWKCRYVHLARSGADDATLVGLARTTPELQRCQSGLGELLAMLVFRTVDSRGNVSLGPYDAMPRYDASAMWLGARAAFAAAFCASHGLPPEAPLATLVRAGALALPTFIKMSTLIPWRPEWNSGDGLIPIEVDLDAAMVAAVTTAADGLDNSDGDGDDGKKSESAARPATSATVGTFPTFHSTFSCPVTREAATAENPPMLLRCGHVIARLTMQRLGVGGGAFKCPYCPVQQVANEAREINI